LITYFNHSIHVAESRWERRHFLANWWRIFAGDPYWVPPLYPTLRRGLEPTRNPHLARMTPIFIQAEALSRRQAQTGRDSWSSSTWSGSLGFGRTVATTAALCDPRREDGVAYLALLGCVNDADSLGFLFYKLAEALWARGCRRVVGPTGLSPYLEPGALEDHWNQLPPLHTAYNPPYLPEILHSLMGPLVSSRLYHLEIPDELHEEFHEELLPSPPGPAELSLLEPARLVTDLLPLLATACSPWANFPSPDAEEAAFLMRWLGHWPLYGWLAQVGGEPVGFVLLGPDVAPLLRRSQGGRFPPWRLWLAWRSRKRLREGRLFYGGVSPEWQGQGIGGQLLHQTLVTGQHLGWERLSIGPVPDNAPAKAFLECLDAHPSQTYRIYQREL
jgi:GNAT superfamily N-acetyltransferase